MDSVRRIRPLIRTIIRANRPEILRLSTQETLSIWRTDSCRFEYGTRVDVASRWTRHRRGCASYLRGGLKRRRRPVDV